ncbi:MAG: hypothetical protein R3C14_41090 [Caldilineaceae bacterium]
MPIPHEPVDVVVVDAGIGGAAFCYYEQDAVLRAMGWYVDPPQPRGYPLPLWDESILAPVCKRAKLWREEASHA